MFTPQGILEFKWNPDEDIVTFPINFLKVNKDILTRKRTPTKREIPNVFVQSIGIIGTFCQRRKNNCAETLEDRYTLG